MDKPAIAISLAHLTGLCPEYKGHIVEVHSPTSPESACIAGHAGGRSGRSGIDAPHLTPPTILNTIAVATRLLKAAVSSHHLLLWWLAIMDWL